MLIKTELNNVLPSILFKVKNIVLDCHTQAHILFIIVDNFEQRWQKNQWRSQPGDLVMLCH